MRGVFAGSLAASATALVVACSSDEPLASLASPKDGGAEATTEAGPIPDAAAPEGGGDLGEIEVVTIADAPCSAIDGFAIEVASGGPTAPRFDRLGSVGARRFAMSHDAIALFTFTPDGRETSRLLENVIAASSDSTSLTALMLGDGGLALERLDPSAAPIGPRAEIPVDPSTVGLAAVAVGAAPASAPVALALWESGGNVVGRVVTDGTVGPAVDAGLVGDPDNGGTIAVAAVWNGTDFSVAWSRSPESGKTELAMAHVDATGHVSTPVAVLAPARGAYRLADFVRTESGYAFLLEERAPAPGVALVRTDEAGTLIRPAYRFAGSTAALSLASSGGGYAVVGALADGRAALRVLGSDGGVAAPWVCVDDSAPATGHLAQAAVDRDEDGGYALIVHETNGASVFRRVDGAGSGLP